jgi:hypothetical protein
MSVTATTPVDRLAATLAERVGERAAFLDPFPETPASPALALLEGRLEAADRAALARLRHGWHARLEPCDEPERTAVDGLVVALWRQGALAAVEERLLRDLLAEGPSAATVRALAVLCRLRARLEKERTAAERDLRQLYRLRPQPIDRPDLNPERLEWLAAKLRRERTRAEAASARQTAPERTGRAPEGAVEPRREEAPRRQAEPEAGARAVRCQPASVRSADGRPATSFPRGSRSPIDPPARGPGSADPLGPFPTRAGSFRGRLLAGAAPPF